jgi:RNA polymerase sigma-70 factor (ECF subfamily)
MQRLRQGLNKLSARQRAVFVLRHHEGLPLQEIADLLGLETGTVKAHLHRAVTALRIELADVYEEAP